MQSRVPLLVAAGSPAVGAAGRRAPAPRTAFLRAMGIGLLAALLFSTTFVVNRSIQLGGGAWEWTASLRYLMMLPLLAVIVLAGMVLAPLLYRDERAMIPRGALGGALVVVSGVALMQAEHAGAVGSGVLLVGVLPVLVAAFAYPVGNRKTMELADGSLDTWQRILAMTIASLPFWLVLAAVGLARTGAPGGDQLAQSAVVAVIGGVLATALFFAATARVRHHPTRLAAVEATQSGEVVFAAGLEVLLLGTVLPSPVAWAGMALIVTGIAGYVVFDRAA